MRILFIGDVVGKVGRYALSDVLPILREKEGIDFVICNGENITHGKGIIEKHYEFLCSLDINAITLGNHYNSKKEISSFINDANRLIRPVNIIGDFPGEGSRVFKIKGKTIRVSNVLCSAFMDNEVSNPYNSIKQITDVDTSDIHIIDLHGEATGEKEALAQVFDGKVTAILGTHTHVQTNDERILPKGSAYISDVGMCGSSISVLGFESESVINKIIFGKDTKFSLKESGDYIFNAVILNIDNLTNKCVEIKKVRIDSYEKNRH
jgi:metallophosphoesterase (TIGR00282 family)